MANIDYSKYENMNERQLVNSLLNAKKKKAKLEAELQEKIKNYEALISFLKAKIDAKLNLDEKPNKEQNELEISKSIRAAKPKEQTKPKAEHKQDLEAKNDE